MVRMKASTATLSSSSSSSRCTRVRACAMPKMTRLRHRLRDAAAASFAAAALLTTSPIDSAAHAARNLASVNRPDLLPDKFSRVIDAAGFLTQGEEDRLSREVESLERDTGFKLRILAQVYPSTPGLAVKDYWGVDGRTVVFVADPSFGNILNFNVGEDVDLDVPRNFWTKLSSRYGTKFYWQEQGEGTSILNTVAAIDSCFREEPGAKKCTSVLNADEYADRGDANKGNSIFGKLFGS